MQAVAAGTSKNDEKLRERIISELESAGALGHHYGDKDLTLEKSWHCLHYLLTGSAGESNSVLGKAILGGKEIGPDVGYGPVRYLEPNEVKLVAKTLKKVSKKDLAARFDLKAMKAAKVYACRNESDLELAQNYFAELCSQYEQAAERGAAMLLYID